MSWENDSACRNADPELFGPVERGERQGEIPTRVLRALRYCHGHNRGDKGPCPVMDECARLREEGGYTGVWGGKWWPSSKAPSGYTNAELKGRQNLQRSTSQIDGEAA